MKAIREYSDVPGLLVLVWVTNHDHRLPLGRACGEEAGSGTSGRRCSVSFLNDYQQRRPRTIGSRRRGNVVHFDRIANPGPHLRPAVGCRPSGGNHLGSAEICTAGASCATQWARIQLGAGSATLRYLCVLPVILIVAFAGLVIQLRGRASAQRLAGIAEGET
jgi:hypothetical protein